MRNSFVRVMRALGQAGIDLPEVVAAFVRHAAPGRERGPAHPPAGDGAPADRGNGLGMTANYTHTRPETMREQVERAMRRWPAVLAYAVEWAGSM